MPRRPAKDKDKEPTFEEALAELERLVEAMEEEELPLEKLVEHYEQGSRLLARCEAVLKSARERFELITLEGAGEADDNSGPNEPPAAPDAPTGGDDDDEIRLF